MSTNENSVRERIVLVASEVFELAPELVERGISPETVEGWDSEKHVVLLVALEDHFGCMFEAEEVPELISLEQDRGSRQPVMEQEATSKPTSATEPSAPAVARSHDADSRGRRAPPRAVLGGEALRHHAHLHRTGDLRGRRRRVLWTSTRTSSSRPTVATATS